MKKRQRAYYLTGKELLDEIHVCKMKHCSFLNDADTDYHHIVKTVMPDPKWVKGSGKPKVLKPISEQKALKAVDLADVMAKVNIKRRKLGLPPLQEHEIVVRVMTFHHIPLFDDVKRSNRATGENHPTMTFPPFKHYRRTIDGKWVEVLRSHWVGSIGNGHFENSPPAISDKLAKMFILLVEKNSKRGNWAGYSYLDEMKGDALVNLMERGLCFNEAESSNTFAYYTTAIDNSFVRHLNNEAKIQGYRDDCLEMAGMKPSSTRQAANELCGYEPPPLVRKRGRPRKAA